jgi:hypothetical protein
MCIDFQHDAVRDQADEGTETDPYIFYVSTRQNPQETPLVCPKCMGATEPIRTTRTVVEEKEVPELDSQTLHERIRGMSMSTRKQLGSKASIMRRRMDRKSPP